MSKEDQQSDNIDGQICDLSIKLGSYIELGEIKAVENALNKCENPSVIVNAIFGQLNITLLQLAAALSGQQEASSIVQLLIKHGAKADACDKIGRSPLHYAAIQGYEDVVRMLVSAGADVNCKYQINSWPYSSKCPSNCPSNSKTTLPGSKLPLPECWGRTPLHQAVKGGHVACVQILLDSGANVNVVDEKGLSPLLLAGAGISSDDNLAIQRFEKIVQLLVQYGGEVNVYNADIKSSPLYHAVALGSLQATICLLGAGAKLDHVTPSVENLMGETVLHVAASTGSAEIVSLLLKHGANTLVNFVNQVGSTPLHKAAYSGSRECLKLLINSGGDLAAVTESGMTVVDIILAYIPQPICFLTEILDKQITANRTSINDRDFKIQLDFNILVPQNNSSQQMAVISAISDNMQLLQHPLVEAFIRIKWAKLRAFFFILVAFHICFVISLSAYAFCWVHHERNNMNELVWSRRILILSASILSIHAIMEIFLLGRNRFRQFEIWLNFICALLSLVVAVAGEHTSSAKQRSNWILHVSSVVVLLAWSGLMFLIGRFPTWGYYALMFSAVLRNVVKVLLTSICLVIGFALSFSVQFPNSHQFADPWQSLVKTTVMMTGEFDYSDLFIKDDPERLVATSRLVFLLFVLLASIVLMNLMVGLAVNDIQGLQTEGFAKRLRKQADFIAHLERVISHKLLTQHCPHRLIQLLETRRVPAKTVIQPSAVARPQPLPCSLLESIINVAVHNRARGIHSVYKGSAINIGRFGSVDIKNKYLASEKTDTKIENSDKEILLNKEIIEMKCMLECILAKMDGHVQGRNSASGEGMSEVDSSNVNALLRRISHSRH